MHTAAPKPRLWTSSCPRRPRRPRDGPHPRGTHTNSATRIRRRQAISCRQRADLHSPSAQQPPTRNPHSPRIRTDPRPSQNLDTLVLGVRVSIPGPCREPSDAHHRPLSPQPPLCLTRAPFLPTTSTPNMSLDLERHLVFVSADELRNPAQHELTCPRSTAPTTTMPST